MLQQTTVAAASPRYVRFLLRFPDVAALASASEKEILAEWSGLGYYGRARNLHRAARVLAKEGGFPRSAEALRRLPGIGAYTAAAVASISFGEPVAVVDGNVARVLARLHARRLSARRPADLAKLRGLADAFLDPRRPGDHNQSMMELGATVCLPRAPLCPRCPLRASCAAAKLGTPERFPGATPRPKPRKLRLAAGVAWRRGRLVLVEDRHLVRGHVVVPLVSLGSREDAAGALRRRWPALTGRRAAKTVALGVVRHSVLDRRYSVRVLLVTEGAPAALRVRVRLVAPEALGREARGGLLEKITARFAGPRR